MKTLTQCRERLDEVLNYFLERADAEYFTDRASPVPNEEMRLLTIVEEIKAFLESDRAQSDDGAVPDGIKRYDFRVIDRSFCEDSWREHAMVESTKGEYVKVKDLGAAPQQPAQGQGVPEEPTERMLEAAMSERDWQHPTNAKRYLCNVWQKMLSAAHS